MIKRFNDAIYCGLKSPCCSPTSFVCNCKDGGTPPDCKTIEDPPQVEPGDDDCKNDEECQEFFQDHRLTCYRGLCIQQRCENNEQCPEVWTLGLYT